MSSKNPQHNDVTVVYTVTEVNKWHYDLIITIKLKSS